MELVYRLEAILCDRSKTFGGGHEILAGRKSAGGRGQHVAVAEDGGGDPWQPYIAQLRKCLNARKRCLEIETTSIAKRPEGAQKYDYVHTLCQDIIELQEDISQFWVEG